MKHVVILIAIFASVLIIAGVFIQQYTPWFANEVVTVTCKGGITFSSTVVTLYSNRLILFSEYSSKSLVGPKERTMGVFASKTRITTEKYSEIAEALGQFSTEGHHMSSSSAMTALDGYIYSIRLNGNEYFTSALNYDRDMDKIIDLIWVEINVS